jgi:glycosyltransferase involved in cell wall biosynthesis
VKNKKFQFEQAIIIPLILFKFFFVSFLVLSKSSSFNEAFQVHKMVTTISVLITVKNAERDIACCIRSLLNQSIKNFEIIIVDDLSSDRTKEAIEKFKDPRIKYYRNEKWLGLAASRNKCLKLATGKYVFFTDADCVASRNWIEEGLCCLEKTGCVGIEGRTYYVSEDYEPTRSDDVIENKDGGQFQTCNIAYSKEILDSIGGFYERLTYLEDRDLAFRVKQFGRILFNSNMIIYHQKKILSWKGLVNKAKNVTNRVLLYKRLNDRTFLLGRILYPMSIVAILFPPLILQSFLIKKYKTREDFRLFPFIYIYILYERLIFWDMCVKERVFLL